MKQGNYGETKKEKRKRQNMKLKESIEKQRNTTRKRKNEIEDKKKENMKLKEHTKKKERKEREKENGTEGTYKEAKKRWKRER